MYWDPVLVRRSSTEERVTAASLVAAAPVARIKTGIDQLDSTVLGGGLCPGCVYLLAGAKGSGKSSLAMLIADAIASASRPVIYASGEESTARVGEIARRMQVTNSHIEVIGDAHDADDVIERCEKSKPALLVLDSLQVMTSASSEGGEGSSAASEAVIHLVQSHCLRTGMVGLVLNHMRKDRTDAVGSETVGHLVDAVLFLDSDVDVDESLRMLWAPEKNRTASTSARAFFRMDDKGKLTPSRRKSGLEM